MKDCSANAFCKICRKENCDKRVEDYIGDMRHIPCNGICHTCAIAIRHHSMIDEEPFASMKDLQTCVMYHLQKHNNIEFYGRQGENINQSLVEQAIYQVYKCKICTYESMIMPMIEKISIWKGCLNDREEVCIENFLAKFKKTKICKHLQEVGSEIMFVISQNNGVNIDEICQQIKISNSFFIHKITINPMIEDLIAQKKIIKDRDEKYRIK